MKIIKATKYNYCQICHIYGCDELIEFEAIAPLKNENIQICKECAESLSELSKKIEE